MIRANELDTITMRPECIWYSGGKVSWLGRETIDVTNTKFGNSGCANVCAGGKWILPHTGLASEQTLPSDVHATCAAILGSGSYRSLSKKSELPFHRMMNGSGPGHWRIR